MRHNRKLKGEEEEQNKFSSKGGTLVAEKIFILEILILPCNSMKLV